MSFEFHDLISPENRAAISAWAKEKHLLRIGQTNPRTDLSRLHAVFEAIRDWRQRQHEVVLTELEGDQAHHHELWQIEADTRRAIQRECQEHREKIAQTDADTTLRVRPMQLQTERHQRVGELEAQKSRLLADVGAKESPGASSPEKLLQQLFHTSTANHPNPFFK